MHTMKCYLVIKRNEIGSFVVTYFLKFHTYKWISLDLKSGNQMLKSSLLSKIPVYIG